MKFSPRIDPRLIDALASLDDPNESVAEIRRRLRVVTDSLDLPRPSYESVRQLVRQLRTPSHRRPKREILADLAFYTGPPLALIEELLSEDVPRTIISSKSTK